MKPSLYIRSANLVGDHFAAMIDAAPDDWRYPVSGQFRDLVFVSVREHHYRKTSAVVRVSATTGRDALKVARRELARAEGRSR